ncbi:MAG: ribonuclease III [Dehalococcoidales bacterium]|nr:ribonuclease III [Dehalococcoidales bacterium]
MANLAVLQKRLGVSFNDPSLLEQALTHSSYTNENPQLASLSNQRLEFLGDAVLGLIIAEKLYRDFPDSAEGELTKLRASLVSGDTLARVARSIKLGDYFYLGKGEEASGGRDKSANLADALEAVVAAIFLDQGKAITRRIILNLLSHELQKIVNHGAKTNYKSQLQELIQAREQLTPIYYVIDTEGPDHEPRFTVEVRAGDRVLGQGVGKSKQKAETKAARSALERLKDDFTS